MRGGKHSWFEIRQDHRCSTHHRRRVFLLILGLTNAGYLFELQGWKTLARQHETEKATMISKSLDGLALEYLCSRFSIRETAYNLRDSENTLCIKLSRANYNKNSFSYSGATYGTNSHVMWGKQNPLRNSIVFLNKYSRARHSWKAAFYLIFLYCR